MTMQAALDAAHERGCWARPIHEDGCAYRYKPRGVKGKLMLAVAARTGKRMREVEEFNPALSRQELLDEWMLCDLDGNEFKASDGPRLSDLC